MELRAWINERAKLVVAAAAVSLLVLLIAFIICFSRDRADRVRPDDKAWFYDLNTGRLFTADAGLVPPTKSPSGPLPDGRAAGVKAYVLSYASEPTESDRFIGFLETRCPGSGDDSSEGGASKWASGKLIKRVEDANWVPADSPWGRRIMAEAFIPNENGERPLYVQP
jgi:hypothetical protein